jgi:hypothetical protein
LAEEYRGQFQVDDQGNWVGGDDSTREAAWSEYFDASAPVADGTTANAIATEPAAPAEEAPAGEQ